MAGYTQAQIDAVPGLNVEVENLRQIYRRDPTPTNGARIQSYIQAALSNPEAYVAKRDAGIAAANAANAANAQKSSSGAFGFISDAVSSVGNAIQNVGDAVADTVKKAADGAADVVRYAADHPLQTIEAIAVVVFAPELAETLGVSVPTATAIANTAVAVANGAKNPEDIAKAAIASYAGAEASGYVTPAASSAATAAGASPTLVKVISSAAGADAAATTSSLIKNNGDLQKAVDDGKRAAITSLVGSASTAAGQEVASNIEDPTLSKIAGTATKAGTAATLAGKDGAAAALTAGAKESAGPLLDQFGNVISDIASNLPSGPSVDFSGLKEAIKPISDVATSIAEPIYEKASDVATAVAEPISKVVTFVAEPVGKAISTVADTVKGALPSGGVKISGHNLDKSIIDLMAKAPGATISGSTSGTTVAGGPDVSDVASGAAASPAVSDVASGAAASPAVSDVASGAAASPAAFGGADVAMLGDTSPEGMGSKVSKKGGKYPWGEPEGTTALKEGLGIG